MTVCVGLGGVLYGYDIGVISGALLFIRHTIPMTDDQMGIIVGAVLGGGLIGTLITGPLVDINTSCNFCAVYPKISLFARIIQRIIIHVYAGNIGISFC